MTATVTEKELISYVRASVLQHTDSQQVSQSFRRFSRDIAVLKLKGGGGDLPDDVKSAIELAARVAATGPINLASAAGGPCERGGRHHRRRSETADFVYDVDKQTVEKKVAGVVAEGVKPNGLPGIMQSGRAIAFSTPLRQAGLRPSRSPRDRAPTSAARS